ncbi:hypothetical protein [Chitinophaga barathri]|uniref:Uncharacterized protein n=1 Tax=Chitinophaga barathri TaxID=1647451 RepID=A0A3N4MEL7_9BACT|nr:hypothetical protein [Chitinophaga barathri]RPD38159.1 hypothetical protein EG028_26220 [Chitinophaga barathri]
MGKQTGLLQFTGRLGNVIGYRRNGEYFLRSAPEEVRQTPATRRASRAFGIASRKARLIREAIVPHLDVRHNSSLVNRLNKTVMLAGKQFLPAIEGFRFNAHAGLEKLLPVPPVFTQDGVLRIPPQTPDKPGKATHLEISVITSRISFEERKVEETDVSGEIIDLDQPFEGLELGFSAPAKGVLLVTLQVRACTMVNGKLYPSGDRRYIAADIVAVIPAPAASAGVVRGKRIIRINQRAVRRVSVPSHYHRQQTGYYCQRE